MSVVAVKTFICGCCETCKSKGVEICHRNDSTGEATFEKMCLDCFSFFEEVITEDLTLIMAIEEEKKREDQKQQWLPLDIQ